MSTIHRIFRIDVGNMPSHKAMERIEQFRESIDKCPDNYIDYFIPVKRDSGIKIIETEKCNCNCSKK